MCCVGPTARNITKNTTATMTLFSHRRCTILAPKKYLLLFHCLVNNKTKTIAASRYETVLLVRVVFYTTLFLLNSYMPPWLFVTNMNFDPNTLPLLYKQDSQVKSIPASLSLQEGRIDGCSF